MRRRTAVLLGSVAAFAATAVAPPSAAARPATNHPAVVPERPRTNTPRVLDGEVSDLEVIGDRVVMAGTFTQIRDTNGTVYPRRYLAAFDQNTGQLDVGFDPVIDRPVNDIAVAPDGSAIYIGGEFNTIDGATKRKVAKLTPAGDVVTAFTAQANSRVYTVVATPTRVYAGGLFTAVNGVARNTLAAVDTTTGAVDAAFNFAVTEGIGVDGVVKTEALDVTADFRTLLVVHSGRRVGGQPRSGVALIDITGAPVLRAWRTRLYEQIEQQLGTIFPTDGEISPDGAFIVVTNSGGDRPPGGDTAIRFPTVNNGTNTPALWVTRLFDSVYSVAISDRAIYVGGHLNFAEAPGSVEPWPGDTNTNYGFGLDERGPAQLGAQVVRRGHVAALDRATGKALAWDPGTDSFRGVTALTAVPNGLLLGHDGNAVGGFANVGRVAFFDFRNAPPAENPDSRITQPFSGSLTPGGSTTAAAGTATGSRGIQRVTVEVQNNAGLYLQTNGTFAAGAVSRNATLSAPGQATTNWALTVPPLPAGDYTLGVRAIDVTGVREPTRTTVKFTARSADPNPPVLESYNPPGETTNFASNSFALTGVATDNQAVTSVRIAFSREATGEYLQSNFTAGLSYYEFSAMLDAPGAMRTGFRQQITLPNGEWRVIITVRDASGGRTVTTGRYFMSPGNQPPTATVTAPSANAVVNAGSITVAGTATDDAGVDSVRIAIERVQTGEGMLADGTFGNRVDYFPVTLANRGAPTTTWSFTTAALPPGTFTVNVVPADAIGLSGFASSQFSVQIAGNPAPAITIQSPSIGQQFATPAVTVSGSATDNAGVAAVRITVRQLYSPFGYLQPNGTFGPARALLDATLATPGGATTTWSRALSVAPTGDYFVYAYAVDNAGQYTLATDATVRFIVRT